MAIIRSTDPRMARWIITGRLFSPFSSPLKTPNQCYYKSLIMLVQLYVQFTLNFQHKHVPADDLDPHCTMLSSQRFYQYAHPTFHYFLAINVITSFTLYYAMIKLQKPSCQLLFNDRSYSSCMTHHKQSRNMLHRNL